MVNFREYAGNAHLCHVGKTHDLEPRIGFWTECTEGTGIIWWKAGHRAEPRLGDAETPRAPSTGMGDDVLPLHPRPTPNPSSNFIARVLNPVHLLQLHTIINPKKVMNNKHMELIKLNRTHWFALLGLTALATPNVRATDGYFDYGYGVQSKGIGGAGVAFPQDALAPAANPAGAAFLADQFDVGLSYLRPDRSATAGGTQSSGNSLQNFYIPEIGFKHAVTADWDLDLAVYGNGGMNTDYAGTLPNFGYAHLGVDLEQLFVAPTLAYKINANNAIGLDPIFALQRFKAYGLEGFGVGDNGYDYSYGGGVRIGYTGKLTDWLTVGATYQSRIFTTKLDQYAGLFAEQGSFDIPSNFALGLAVKPLKQVTVALDVERMKTVFITDTRPPSVHVPEVFGHRRI